MSARTRTGCLVCNNSNRPSGRDLPSVSSGEAHSLPVFRLALVSICRARRFFARALAAQIKPAEEVTDRALALANVSDLSAGREIDSNDARSTRLTLNTTVPTVAVVSPRIPTGSVSKNPAAPPPHPGLEASAHPTPTRRRVWLALAHRIPRDPAWFARVSPRRPAASVRDRPDVGVAWPCGKSYELIEPGG